jgi:hypothetical protein
MVVFDGTMLIDGGGDSYETPPSNTSVTTDTARVRRGEEADRPTVEPSIDYAAIARQSASEGEAALAEAERLAQLAREAEARAKVEQQLAESEAAKKAAEEAAAKAKAEADAAAAAAAKAAAEEKAKYEAALAKAKADAEAAAKAAANANAADKARLEAEARAAAEAAERARLAAEAATKALDAAKNINVGGNVFLPGTPAAGGLGAADILAKQYAEQQAAREKEQAMQRQSIMDVLTDRFNRYNLKGLIPTIKRLAQEGATEATITLALQETEDYKRRFRGNEERIKKGLSVLNPAEYLNVEDSYRQILRSYGLTQFDNDEYVSQFIANDMSPAELSNRVVTAVQRVRNADPAISRTLKDYYGIGNQDLVAYVLDPNQQFQKIERQVAAAEIGSAGRLQGIDVGIPVAEQLAAQGITQAQAQRGYATIADILPTAEKLSDIYGKQMDEYGLQEAEQEVFNQLASAQRKRQRLTQREIAEFSGQSGVGRTSLGGTTGGQF